MTNNPYGRRVKDVMSKQVVTVDLGATAHDAIALMVENRVSGLPVVDRREHCVGILSASDLVDLAHDVDDELIRLDRQTNTPRHWWLGEIAELGMDHRNVKELMSTTVAAVGPETSLVETAQEMLRQRVHRLPVLNERRHILGIISTTDILTAFANGSA